MRRARQGLFVRVLVVLLVHVAPAAASCTADSGTEHATLVELYTSEGCSSCPPADQRLGELARQGPKVVPLALHVDYWDSIGWKDPYAQPAFARRQAWEVQANHSRTSYTPHFFVDGVEVLDWRSDLDVRLGRATATTRARILVDVQRQGSSGLHVKVDGALTAGDRTRGPWQLFVVVTESALSSRVDAGENRGARLHHDAVARQWIGPIALQDGRAALDRTLDVPQLAAGRVGVVAFVQDATTAEVLQAVDTGVCRSF